MRKYTTVLLCCLGFATSVPTIGLGDVNDWAEGTPGLENGATRDHYNRAGLLSWRSYMGDWRDAGGVAQGETAFAVANVVDNDTGRFIEWDVTAMVQEWVDGRLAWEKTDLRFRDVAGLKIEEVWMNVYHGGSAPSPHDQHLYVDNLVIASNYIGPGRGLTALFVDDFETGTTAHWSAWMPGR